MLGALLGVAAINYTADPYGIFDSRIDSQPLTRELFQSNVRLAKAHIVSSFRPEAIILGSSRAEVGLSPGHPAWQYDRVYNLGLPKASIREIARYLEHAIAAGALEQAVVGLDFFQFNPLLEPPPDFAECRLRQPGSLWSRIRAATCDVPTLLFSRRALFESVRLWGDNAQAAVYLRDGSRSDVAKEADLQSAGSQHAAFLMSEFEYFDRSELLRGFLESEANFEKATGPHFEELLRLCYRHGIDLRIVLSPSHARHWEVVDEMGLWEVFLRWKRYLIMTTRRIATEFNAEPFPIWDFADYNAYTLESLPPLGDTDSRMQWHWESSHYKHALGVRVLDEILGGDMARLGTRLSIDDFDAWTRGMESRRAEYRLRAATELELLHDYLFLPATRQQIQDRSHRQN